MVRPIVFGLATLLITTSSFAGGLVVYPRAVTLRVGEHAELHAENQPGGLSHGYPYSVKFISDDRSVAEVEGFASGSGYLRPDPIPHNGDVSVTAIAPGVAHVRVNNCCGDLATITVLPLPVVTIEPNEITIVKGQAATFVAVISRRATGRGLFLVRGQSRRHGGAPEAFQRSRSPFQAGLAADACVASGNDAGLYGDGRSGGHSPREPAAGGATLSTTSRRLYSALP